MYHIRRVQEKMAAMPNCFTGPDYDTGLQPADRFDNIHLSDSGQTKAAKLWADVLTDSFFLTSDPIILEPVPQPVGEPVLNPSTTTPVIDEKPITADPLGVVSTTNRSGVISSSILPDLSKISDLAAIGLIMLAIGSLAFYLRQFFKND